MVKADAMKSHANTDAKVLSPFLKKHVHTLVNKQKTGELNVVCGWGAGRGEEGVIVTEKYGTPWGRVKKIKDNSCFSQKPPYLGF